MGKRSHSQKKEGPAKKSSSKSTGVKAKEAALGKKVSKKASTQEGLESTKVRRTSARLAAPDTSVTPNPSSRPTGTSARAASVKSDKEVKAVSQGTKQYRRKPADIDGSEDSSDVQDITNSKKKARSLPDETDGDDDRDDEDQDEETRLESANEEDLLGLSSAKAKETLELEQPQWSTKQGDVRLSQKDPKVEKKSHKKQSLTKRKRSSDISTDSSSSGESDSDSESKSSDSDESNGSDSSDRDSSDLEENSNESSSESERDHDSGGALLSKKSKRAQDRQSEGARWKDTKRKVSGPQVKRQKTRDVNDGWPSKAHYTAPTGRSITLKEQPKRLRVVLKKAMEEAEGDILFVNAFPSGLSSESYIRKLLKRHAQEQKNQALVSRIKDDPSFRSALAPLITSRMNRLRGNIKKFVSSGVIVNTYGLSTSDAVECRIRVTELQKSMDYIYPPGPNSTFDRTKPYRNELVISILRDYIFTGRPSLSDKFGSRFDSSIETDKDNVEIPIATLALVGTAISAGLEDWSTGAYKKKSWSSETYSGTYENHVEFITSSIFEADRKKFHSLTSKLYQLASNTRAQTAKISNVQLNFKISDMNDDD